MALSLVGAWGCSGADGADGADGTDGQTVLFGVSDEPAGANCANGGSRIDHGIDTNANGVLDAEEILGTFYTCDGTDGTDGDDGTNGTDGQSALVTVTDEAAGSNCASGGYRIDSGLDADADGILDAGEITATEYICHGADGADGSDGIDGQSALVAVTAVSAGTGGCDEGGYRVDSGLDADADGVLDGGEITASVYVCHGLTGADGSDGVDGHSTLVTVTDVPAGTGPCVAGGYRVESGLDLDDDGVLDPVEITSTNYVCHGADGASALVVSEDVFANAFGCAQGYHVTSTGVDDGAGGGTAGDGLLQDGEIRSFARVCLAPDFDGDGFLNLADDCPALADPLQNGGYFDCVAPTMYGITRGDSSVSSKLYLYDVLANTATLIGDTGHAFITIKVNPVDGQLYGMTRVEYAGDPGGCGDCLMRIDTSTAAATLIADLPPGPHSSMAFLSTGALHTWTESSDSFTVVDVPNATYTELGPGMSSATHGMCATGADQILWINYDGSIYLINPTDGAMGLVGNTGVGPARGDCDPTSLFYIGTNGGWGATNLVALQLRTDGAPTHLYTLPMPVANLHYFALVR